MAVFSLYYYFQLHCHANLILKPITGDSKVFLSKKFTLAIYCRKVAYKWIFFEQSLFLYFMVVVAGQEESTITSVPRLQGSSKWICSSLNDNQEPSYSWQVNLPGLEDPRKPVAEIICMQVEHGFCEQSVPELLPLWGLLQEHRRGCSRGMVQF